MIWLPKDDHSHAEALSGGCYGGDGTINRRYIDKQLATIGEDCTSS